MLTTLRGKSTLMALLVLICSSVASAAPQNYEQPVMGAWYKMSETYDATFDIEGTASGNIGITAETQYRFVDMRQYTQNCPEIQGGTYDVYYIEWTGIANLNGRANVSVSGINLNNLGIRASNATFNGKIWLRTSDLATVAKKREISGTAEAALIGNNFINAGTIAANEFEEYILPLEDFRFPLAATNPTYEQHPTVCAYGDYAANISLIGVINENFADTFSTTIDINFSVSVPRDDGRKALKGQFYDYAVSEEYSEDFDTPASQSFWYSSQLKYILKQEISQLAVAGVVNLQGVTLEVTDFNVPTPSGPTATPTIPNNTPTPTPTTPSGVTNTPTPTMTPTGKPETPTPTPPAGNAGVGLRGLDTGMHNNTIIVDLRAWNMTGASEEIMLFVVLELGGSYYAYPSFSTALAPLATFVFPSGLEVPYFELINIPLGGTVGNVPVTWYGAMVDMGGTLFGEMAVLPMTLN